jgi:hypothetical protein
MRMRQQKLVALFFSSGKKSNLAPWMLGQIRVSSSNSQTVYSDTLGLRYRTCDLLEPNPPSFIPAGPTCQPRMSPPHSRTLRRLLSRVRPPREHARPPIGHGTGRYAWGAPPAGHGHRRGAWGAHPHRREPDAVLLITDAGC